MPTVFHARAVRCGDRMRVPVRVPKWAFSRERQRARNDSAVAAECCTCNARMEIRHCLDMNPSVGSRQAADRRFAEVFEHLGLIIVYARRRGAVDPEEIAAEVMTIAWRRLPEVPVGDPRPWLIATARNLVFADWRRDNRERSGLEQVGVPVAAEPPAPARDLDPDLEAALRAVSVTDREALLLVAWEELTPSQAARSLELSPVAFRVRLHRARRRLRIALSETEDEQTTRHPIPTARDLATLALTFDMGARSVHPRPSTRSCVGEPVRLVGPRPFLRLGRDRLGTQHRTRATHHTRRNGKRTSVMTAITLILRRTAAGGVAASALQSLAGGEITPTALSYGTILRHGVSTATPRRIARSITLPGLSAILSALDAQHAIPANHRSELASDLAKAKQARTR
jgi:RNA polymerase sigma factor (sigma-70 family)